MAKLEIKVTLVPEGEYSGKTIAEAELNIPDDTDENGIRGVAGETVGRFLAMSAAALGWRSRGAAIGKLGELLRDFANAAKDAGDRVDAELPDPTDAEVAPDLREEALAFDGPSRHD